MNEHNIKSNPKNDYLDVLYNGLVFRLTLFHVKQIIELKKVVDETGVLSYEDNEESIKQEQKFIMLPRLMGSLHGLVFSLLLLLHKLNLTSVLYFTLYIYIRTFYLTIEV